MRKYLIILLLGVVFASCQTEVDNFVIKNKQVGKLTDTTTVKQMKQLYQNDSIVKNSEGKSAFEPFDEYIIYDKQTKKPLLTIVAQKVNDENSLLKYIEIESELFHTEKGVNLHSDFGSVSKNHKIGKIDETFKYIVIYLDDLNATIDIPKSSLPVDTRNNLTKIDVSLIPETTKIKHFVLFFND